MSHDMHKPMPTPTPTSTSTSMPDSTMNHMDHMGMMHMTFFWGKDFIMLFDDWPNEKLGMYILALLFVFVLAVVVEFFSACLTINKGASPFVGGLTQALVYGLRMALAYVLMLAVMSYNLGVFIVAVVGHVVGFFLVKYRVALKAKDEPI